MPPRILNYSRQTQITIVIGGGCSQNIGSDKSAFGKYIAGPFSCGGQFVGGRKTGGENQGEHVEPHSEYVSCRKQTKKERLEERVGKENEEVARKRAQSLSSLRMRKDGGSRARASLQPTCTRHSWASLVHRLVVVSFHSPIYSFHSPTTLHFNVTPNHANHFRNRILPALTPLRQLSFCRVHLARKPARSDAVWVTPCTLSASTPCAL